MVRGAAAGLFAHGPTRPRGCCGSSRSAPCRSSSSALLFNDVIEQVLRTPAVAAGALAVGAVLMLAAERVGPRTRTEESIGWREALLIGCAQAAALIPGMSRSGSTITVGMFLGMRRDAAARFTFLLAIPAMLAAAAKEALELLEMPLPDGSGSLLAVGHRRLGGGRLRDDQVFPAVPRGQPARRVCRLPADRSPAITVVWLLRH